VSLTVDVSKATGVHPETCPRPFIRCAVVDVAPLDDVALATLMKLQENLHWGVGRDRKLASIGVYDLATIQGPITYRSIDPAGATAEDRFAPLGMPDKQMSGAEILAEHAKGKAYAGLLGEYTRYPVLMDARGVVLSMPPIINSEATRVRPGSTRLFVDVTGPSDAAVTHCLNMVCASLAELGGKVSTVAVTRADGQILVTPDLSPKKAEVDLPRAKQWLGLPLTAESLVDCLERMRLDVRPLDATDVAKGPQGATRFEVTYPAFRSDIRHQVDLLEDLAIGFGYENIVPALVPTLTVGRARPEEAASTPVREALLGLGYHEIMSLPMTTEADHFTKLRLEVPKHFVQVQNPKLRALTVVRSHLMGGVLAAMNENKRRVMPVRLFELDNCVRLDPATPGGETASGSVNGTPGSLNGTTEERRLCFAEMGPDAGYASVRGVLDALFFELGQTPTYIAIEHPAFVPGRVAKVSTDGGLEGLIGEIHPGALVNFGLELPVGLVDLRVATLDFSVI
jgi:phenylalanyl-tRNA synthetase beta chain